MSWRAPRTRARTLATVLLLTVAAAEVTFNLKICPDSSCSVGCWQGTATSGKCLPGSSPWWVSIMPSFSGEGNTGTLQLYSGDLVTHTCSAPYALSPAIQMTLDGNCHAYTTAGGAVTGSYSASFVPPGVVALIVIFGVIVPVLCCVLASIRWCSCCGCGRKVLGWQTAPAPPESSIPPQMQVMTPQQQMQMQSPYPAQPQPYPQQQAYGGQGGAYPPQASYAPPPQYGGGQYGGQAPAGYPPVAQLAVPQGYNGPQPGLGQYFPQQPYAVPAKSL